MLDTEDHNTASLHISKMNMVELATLLSKHQLEFEDKLYNVVDSESGAAILRKISKSISDNIQLKLFSLLEGNV